MCSNILVLRILYLFKVTLNIVRFAIPLGLIITITLDLYKNLIINKEDDKYSIFKKVSKKIFAAILIFCIPTLINLVFDLLNKMNINSNNSDSTLLNCYQEVDLDLIKKLESEQELKLSEQEEEKRKNALVAAQENEAKTKALQEENAKRMESEKENNSSSGSSSGGTYSDTTTDMKKQNNVYIKNGTFYVPKYNANDKNTWSGRECPGSDPMSKGYNNKWGYNNYFWTMLQNLKTAAKNAGYDLDFDHQGCRSYSYQVSFYQRAEKGRAARPGRSNHGWGIASDVTFYKNSSTKCGNIRTYSNCPGMKWVHDHAKEYGLHFPLLNASYKEDWHIEPVKLVKY